MPETWVCNTSGTTHCDLSIKIKFKIKVWKEMLASKRFQLKELVKIIWFIFGSHEISLQALSY